MVVAMSGGVDSSVAAALAVEQGFEVIGVSMQLSGDASRCCSLADADDARRVAEQLGIRFFVANYAERFRDEVVLPFADEYLAGRTPIPCVACNTRFKFAHLLERARVFGATQVATGHYARIDRDPATGLRRLRRGSDRGKDQSYFLFELSQAQLERACFPVGELSKREVRERARELALKTADKPESQEICFVPDGDYARVVESLRPEARELTGEIVDDEGRVLGHHAGVHHFTVGQRRGLGISADRPLYVRRIEARSQRVVVADAPGLLAQAAELVDVHWVSGEAPCAPIEARVQVRHRHEPALAKIESRGPGRALLRFAEPVRAVAPGQAAVFYDADVTLGGGWIRETHA